MSYIIDKAYWVVFNPTAEDYTNSDQTSESAQKDISGTRFWLTKKAGSEGYNYTGKGNYTGGPITDIAAILMAPSELAILSMSPRYDAASFDTLKQLNNNFIDSEIAFKTCFLQLLEFQLLQEDATPANIATAYSTLASAMTNINTLDFDNAYTNLNAAAAPSGSFTAAIKTNMLSLITGYLKKFPR
jgi:hypothetical protein